MTADTKTIVDHRMTGGLAAALLLTAAGGSMDAYSYLVRGGVFATGQTGNLVLVALGAARQDRELLFRAMVPIAAFIVGAVLAQILCRSVFYGHRRSRQWLIPVAEAIVLALVALIPARVEPIWANTVLSFSAAVQFCCFKSFGSGAVYATVFCTGNLRSAVEHLFRGLVEKDRQALRSGGAYAMLILAFGLGAVVCYLCIEFWGEAAILAVALLLLVAAMRLRFDAEK
ncbi:MAG: YoaK family protein [Eubacteriales bacterium]|nr:YoaK family protein [Eubacteriales bacterium]